MKFTHSAPRFIESGDDQGDDLELPLYVSRQVDEETSRILAMRKRLLITAAEEGKSNLIERQKDV